MSEFSANEYLRYTRHFQLPQMGIAGQTKLRTSKVLVIGCGGLGAPVSLYLAAAGIGTITLVDGDNVELSNLQRQITFSEQDIGKNKALCTQTRLQALNSAISVNAIEQHLNEDNCIALIGAADIVVDCTDNFSARYLINDNCKRLNKPWIYASVFQFSGQCAAFHPEGPCFRCLYPQPPTEIVDCNTAGVLGSVPGILGTLQATEAIKQLLDLEGALRYQLLLVEALNIQTSLIGLSQNKECACCNHTFESTTSAQKIQAENCSIDACSANTISADAFEQLKQDDNIQLVDVRSSEEHNAFNLGGLNIPLEDILLKKNVSNDDKLATQLADKKQAYVLYCQSGKRSEQATTCLIHAGFTNVSNLQGGLTSWLKYRND